MFLLIFDVFNQCAFFLDRQRKGSIAVLPMSKVKKHLILLDPTRASDFDVLHEVAQSQAWMQAGENMNVIFNTVDAIKMGVLVLDNSPDVFVELRPTVSEKSSFPVLGRKDDVIEDLGVGRRTALAEDSTPPGLTVRRTSTTGFAAGRCPFAAPVATHIQALRAFGGLNTSVGIAPVCSLKPSATQMLVAAWRGSIRKLRHVQTSINLAIE